MSDYASRDGGRSDRRGRTGRHRRGRLLRVRDGVTLVELMVAVILVGITVTTLSGLTFQSARDARVMAGDGYMRGIIVQETNRLHAVPFTQLAAGTNCVTISTGTFPHTRCYKVVDVSKEKKTVTIVITPLEPGVPALSTAFTRFQPSSYNPLNFP